MSGEEPGRGVSAGLDRGEDVGAVLGRKCARARWDSALLWLRRVFPAGTGSLVAAGRLLVWLLSLQSARPRARGFGHRDAQA